LLNRGDFRASQEALERVGQPQARPPLVQALLDVCAGFHRLIVEDDGTDASRLLERAELALAHQTPYATELDTANLLAQLRAWQKRLQHWESPAAPIRGLPRLERSPAASAEAIRLDSAILHEVEDGATRAVLVAVSSGGCTGWGECRHRWGTYGLWESLVQAIVPAVLADPVGTPGELPILVEGVSDVDGAAAGVEEAVWDLWARLHDMPLAAALGLRVRPVPLSVRVQAGDPDEVASALAAALARPFAMVVLPARPNADRRLVPSLAERCERPVALDLGRAYRTVDAPALEVLACLEPELVADPVPNYALAAAERLRRQLAVPVALGGWRRAPEPRSAVEFGALDAVIVDSGLCGIAEALDLLDDAVALGRSAWIVSSAATSVGVAADLALALHPASAWPADLSSARDAAGQPLLQPGKDGRTAPREEAGLGVVPDPQWLERATRRRLVLGS
jgi:O-succinylbenzoate synthase